MKLGEFFMALGFDVEDQKLTQFENKMTGLPTKFTIVAAAATAALFALDKFTEGSVRAATALQNFNNQTGRSIIDLQKWQGAAILSNAAISVDEVSSSIKALEQNIAQIKLGAGNAAPFQLLGLDPFGGAFSVLDQLRDKIKGKDRPMAVNLIQQLGLSPELINVLQLTRKEFDALSGTLIRSEKTTAMLVKLGQATRIAKERFSLWKDNLAAKMAPALIMIVKILELFANSIGNIIGGISDAVDWLDKLADSSAVAAAFINALAITFGVLAIAMFPVTASFAVILAGVLSLILLIEDLIVFIEGGDSMIGRFIDSLGKIGDKLEKALKPLKDKFQKYLIDPIEKAINLADELVKRANKFLGTDNDDPNAGNWDNRTKGFQKLFDKEDPNYLFRIFQDRDEVTGAQLQQGGIINNIEMNITTTADAEETANLIVNKAQQLSFNTGMADVNNGAIY